MCITNSVHRLLAAAGVAAAVTLGSGTASAQNTTFTYQGVLEDSGSPVDGSTVIDFRLFDAETGGTQVGSTITEIAAVDEGVFSADLDFGASSFAANQDLWLEIQVGVDVFPRQRLNATPFALNTRGISVDADGNVGIGVEAGGRKVSVRGPNGFVLVERDNNPAGVILRTFDDDTYTTETSEWRMLSGNDGNFQLQNANNGFTLPFVVTPTDRVGIGTTNPLRRLHVAGDGTPVDDSALQFNTPFVFSDEDAIVELVSDGAGGVGSTINFTEVDAAGLNTTTWTIDRTTGVGRLRFGPKSGSSLIPYFQISPTNNGEFQLVGTDDVSPRAVIGRSLNVADAGRMFTLDSTGIRNTMDIAPDGTAFMLTDQYLTTSDERLKRNIATIADPIETVAALRGVTYDRINGSLDNELGFIAQEVEEVLPQLVHADSEGMKSVSYDRMTALLVEAVKAQQAEIELLEAKIESMESQRSVVGASAWLPLLVGGVAISGIAVARRRMTKA